MLLKNGKPLVRVTDLKNQYLTLDDCLKVDDETFDLFLPVLGKTSCVFFSASFLPYLIALKIGNMEGLCLKITTSLLLILFLIILKN